MVDALRMDFRFWKEKQKLTFEQFWAKYSAKIWTFKALYFVIELNYHLLNTFPIKTKHETFMRSEVFNENS